MRWIFRGWDAVGQKGWVYGDLVHDKKITLTGLEDRIKIGGYEVVPESVGVCIEKKDDFDNILYEGDICKIACYGKIINAVIVYIDSKGSFYFRSNSLSIPMDYPSIIQKIGNIFKNKDLLVENVYLISKI